MSTTVSERCPNCEAGSGEEVSRMTDLDLAAIRQRVHGINNGSHPVRFSEARDDLNALLAKIDRLNATIQRVRELHEPFTSGLAEFCTECSSHGYVYCDAPCPTILALEGGEQ